jgi:hypothetical protein
METVVATSTGDVALIPVEDGSPLLGRMWLVVHILSHAHVVPDDERGAHELDRGCWCRPHVEAVGARLVIAHQGYNAASA